MNTNIAWDNNWHNSWGCVPGTGVSATVLPLSSGLWDYRVLPPAGAKVPGWQGIKHTELAARVAAQTLAQKVVESLAPERSVWEKIRNAVRGG